MTKIEEFNSSPKEFQDEVKRNYAEYCKRQRLQGKTPEQFNVWLIYNT